DVAVRVGVPAGLEIDEIDEAGRVLRDAFGEALALAQSLLRRPAFDRRPATFDDFPNDCDFAPGPIARCRLVHSHDGAKIAILDERAGDDRLDADGFQLV